MDKKTITTIAIVLAVVIVAGGLYYGFSQWRQQRLANQILNEMYGSDASKFGGLSDKLAAEMAKEAAKQEADDKKAAEEEAAKTPEDKYNETEEVALTGEMATVAKDKIIPIFESAYGKVKPIMFSSNYMGQEGSFLVSFKIPSIPDGTSLNKLSEEFTSNGYKVVTNVVSNEGGNLMVEKDNIVISISYESPEDQEVGAMYLEEKVSE